MIINVESMLRTLSLVRETAIQCGMYQQVTLGYGTLLGWIRENGFIAHDDDADLVILADKITPEQEADYFHRLHDLGLFDDRHKVRRRGDTGRLVWTSMKHGKRDTKCCTWYFQRIDKWYFHGKGKDWVWKIGARLTPPVPQDYDGVMKGVRASYFDHMVERDFMGLKFYRPVKAASLLDYWYPNWAVPKEGVSSKEDMLLIIPKWKDRNSWIMKRR